MKLRPISELGPYIRGISGKVAKAGARALLQTANAATNQAKRNASKLFKGTRENPPQGFLLNSIFAGFQVKGMGKRIAQAYVAVRSRKGSRGTRPYGRIQEYGGEVRPKKAKYLWLPLIGRKASGERGQFRDMTPRDFMKAFLAARKGKATSQKYRNRKGRVSKVAGTYVIMPDQNGKKTAWFIRKIGRGKNIRQKFIAIFQLRSGVDIPARPYIRPAVEQEWAMLNERITREINKGKKTKDGGKVPPSQGG